MAKRHQKNKRKDEKERQTILWMRGGEIPTSSGVCSKKTPQLREQGKELHGLRPIPLGRSKVLRGRSGSKPDSQYKNTCIRWATYLHAAAVRTDAIFSSHVIVRVLDGDHCHAISTVYWPIPTYWVWQGDRWWCDITSNSTLFPFIISEEKQ